MFCQFFKNWLVLKLFVLPKTWRSPDISVLPNLSIKADAKTFFCSSVNSPTTPLIVVEPSFDFFNNCGTKLSRSAFLAIGSKKSSHAFMFVL